MLGDWRPHGEVALHGCVAATAAWPIPPLGIDIEPTVLAAGRACSAFLLLLVALAIGRRRDLVIGRRDVPVLRRLRCRRSGDGPLHVLQDHLADERGHGDPARVPGTGHRPRGRRRVSRPQVHVGAAGRRRAVRRRMCARGRSARRRWTRRLAAGHRVGPALGGVLRRLLAHGHVRGDPLQPVHDARVGTRIRVAVLARRARPERGSRRVLGSEDRRGGAVHGRGRARSSRSRRS